MSQKSLLFAGKWLDLYQTCTRWSQVRLHPECAESQGRGQRSRDGISYSVIDGLVYIKLVIFW